MDASRSQVPLYRFFIGLAEYTFQTKLGIADPPLIDYIAELLSRFVHCDAIYKVRNPTGERLFQLAEMLMEAEARRGDPKREVHRHIGDFTLFWAGVYPEALRGAKRKAQLDFFGDYCQQGKRSYYIASTLRTDDNDEQSDVLERLSHDFELCAYGLGELRREWEQSDRPPEQDGRAKPYLIE
ncbi:MAG TPA: hypothetical protein VHZ24_07585 [Pirellulales bacterium]|jgi:hypothetical protein|nr:hypothetical protein [Pirellulales bacterium]